MLVGVDYGFVEIDMQFMDEKGQFGPGGLTPGRGSFASRKSVT